MNATTKAFALAAAAALLAGCGEDSVSRNTAPEIAVAASLTLVKAGEAVSFSAGATDAEGNIVNYRWDLGDGSSVSGSAYETVDHAYAGVGTYLVALTVTDEEGLAASGTITIEVTPAGGPPTLTIERLEVRGRVVDETVDEVTVNGASTVPLTNGVFTWTDDSFAGSAGYTFDAVDQGGGSDARTVTLSEM